MEATHDLDFLLWCLAPRKLCACTARVASKYNKDKHGGAPDHQWIMVTLDDGTTLTVGSGASAGPLSQLLRTYMQDLLHYLSRALGEVSSVRYTQHCPCRM